MLPRSRFGDLAGGTWQRIVGTGVKLRNPRTDGTNDRTFDDLDRDEQIVASNVADVARMPA
jgi:hypothetical protein